MATVSAEILEVVVGLEQPTTYSLALYEKNGVKLAMFVTQQPDTRWLPTQMPPAFAENEIFFQEFTADLADRGYILDTWSARLQ